MASVVIAIVVGGLAAHVRGAGLVWRRSLADAEELQRLRVTLHRMALDLTNAVSLRRRSEPRFGTDALQFSTVQPAADDADDRLQRAWRVRVVTYTLEERDGVRALVRRLQTPAEADAGIPARAEPLLSPVEQIAFRYGVVPRESEGGEGLVWSPIWDDPEHPPRLVEVTLRLGDGSSVGALRQVLVIPTGSLMSEQTG